MKQALIAFITVLALTACGREYRVDPEFQTHVDSFIRYSIEYSGSEIRPKHLIVEWRDGDLGGKAAKCFDLPFSTPTIRVRRDAWPKTPDMQEMIIFHELGHCILGLGHSEGDSIMNPQLINLGVYQWSREKILFEFFSGFRD